MNLYATWLCDLWIYKRLRQSLIPCRHNFMERKQELSNEVVRLQVLNVFVVITVEDLNLESVLLLKLKVHNNFTDKLRI